MRLPPRAVGGKRPTKRKSACELSPPRILSRVRREDYVIGAGDLIKARSSTCPEISRESCASAERTIGMAGSPSGFQVAGFPRFRRSAKITVLEGQLPSVNPAVSVTVKEKTSPPDHNRRCRRSIRWFIKTTPGQPHRRIAQAGGITPDASGPRDRHAAQSATPRKTHRNPTTPQARPSRQRPERSGRRRKVIRPVAKSAAAH